MVYEKLSKNALRCMYAAGAVTGVILLAVIGAVDYFWVFPEDIDAGKWISSRSGPSDPGGCVRQPLVPLLPIPVRHQ